MRTRSGLAAVMVAAALLLAACDNGASGSAVSEGGVLEGTGESADYGFEATTLAGEPFDGRDLAGRPAVLWFWAPWCPTCRAQIPNLEQQAAAHGDEVAFVGVGGLDSEDSIEQAAGDIANLTHLVDPDGLVWRHFEVRAQSTYTVIDADGEILSEGYLDDGDLNDLVEALAAE